MVEHEDKIRKEFRIQASHFGTEGLTLSSRGLLNWIVENLPLSPGLRILDVATGTGHLGRGVAAYVRSVTGIDLTPEMLSQARSSAAADQITNVLLECGNATHLPHADNAFDMVVSRLAIHHFLHPEVQLGEMVRVCHQEGRVAIIDLVSPDDPVLATSYNRLERLRDPSHTTALTQMGMVELMSDCGLVIENVISRDVPVDFQRWGEMTRTSQETLKLIAQELNKEIAGRQQSGMRPFMMEGRLKFTQTWCVFYGRKVSD